MEMTQGGQAQGGKLRLPARASLWYVASSAVARGASMLGTPIFTRLLTPEEYGLYPIFNVWLGLFGALATLELTGGVLYRALQKFSSDRDDVCSTTLGLCLIPTALLAILYAVFYKAVNSFTGLTVGLGALLFSQVLVNLPISVYSARCRYEYRYREIAGMNIIGAILTPLSAYALITFTPLRAEGRIIASLLVSLPISVYATHKLLSAGARLFAPKVWRFLLGFGLPLLPHYLSGSVILRAGEVAVERFHGAGAMGKFAVASSVGLGLTVISTGISSALTPWSLRKLAAGRGEELKELLKLIASGLGVAILLLLCFVPEAMRLIAPVEYGDALGAVYPIAASLLPMFLSGAVTAAEGYYERSGAITLPSVLAAAASVGLAVLIVPRLDFRAAGFCALFSYILLASLSFISFRRLSGFYPISLRFCAGLGLLFSLYSTVAFLLSHSLLARILLALPLIPAGFKLSKEVLNKIRER